MQQYFALKSKCRLCDRSLFPEDTTTFIKKNNSKNLSDWILSNKGWIAASIKRLNDGDNGSHPIIDWIGTAESNNSETLKRVRENRRKQILIEQEREENKKAERKKKRREKKQKLTSPTDTPITQHYKVVHKTKRKAKHNVKKKLENDSRKKERRREKTKKTKQTKLMPFLRKNLRKTKSNLRKIKSKFLSSVESSAG